MIPYLIEVLVVSFGEKYTVLHMFRQLLFWARTQGNHQKHWNTFLSIFWAYVGQPDNHIGWATLMILASLKFLGKNIENWWFSKTWVSHFKFYFASSPWKSVKIDSVARMGRNFDNYPDFQPKTPAKTYATQCRLMAIKTQILRKGKVWRELGYLAQVSS